MRLRRLLAPTLSLTLAAWGLCASGASAQRLRGDGTVGSPARAASLSAEAVHLMVEGTLAQADPLRGRGGDALTRGLVARADAALKSAGRGGELDAKLRARARRLLAGAHAAAAERDLTLALRRAYYACELLAACGLETPPPAR
ncbi:MAG: hypothetical protein EXR95_05515 [Gemmatimonadetes bacterium]|nr:hypothetical protein [Gemmatimonadota bacterium]